ncbi:MAG: hypothetical protein IT186_04450 [Acidobacteria bacterium]|nr:hypothetical protein [Acidobacteriota bacterium]MCG3193932.1 hypothetical protein [Thermoanaerobaculia bacterium]
MDSSVASSAVLPRAWLSTSIALLSATTVVLAPAFGSEDFRVSGLFGQTLRLMAAAAVAFALGAHAGSVLPWLSRKVREEVGPSPPLLAAGTFMGAIGGFFVSAFLSTLVFSRMGPGGALASRAALVLAVLAGAVAGAMVLGRFPARPPASGAALASLVLLPFVLLAPGLWLLLSSPSFPASASIAGRNSWAQKNLAPHYGQASGFLRSSPALVERLGTDLAIAPLAGTKNRVVYGPGESTASFTLEVASPKGRGRCEVEMTIPYSPKGAPPSFGPAKCEIEGLILDLSGTGEARPGGYTAPGPRGQGVK